MADNEKIGKRPPRLRRESKVVQRVEAFVTTHKIIVTAVALIGIGAAGALYTNKYATKSDIDKKHTNDQAIYDQIQRLKETDAEFRSTLEAVKKSSEETRSDIKILLQHVLANPPKAD